MIDACDFADVLDVIGDVCDHDRWFRAAREATGATSNSASETGRDQARG
jgi:hypothetical protein